MNVGHVGRKAVYVTQASNVDAMRAVDARSSAVPKPQGATLMSTTLAANATTFNITLPVLC
ncbi:MAG: hypothetical protein AB7E72_20470, partial [Lysobacterales bacterium]